jgi:hypothetical protein
MGCGCNKKKEEIKVTNTQENFTQNKIFKKTKEFFNNNICGNKKIMIIFLLILLLIVIYTLVLMNTTKYIKLPKGYIPPSEYNWYPNK